MKPKVLVILCTAMATLTVGLAYTHMNGTISGAGEYSRKHVLDASESRRGADSHMFATVAPTATPVLFVQEITPSPVPKISPTPKPTATPTATPKPTATPTATPKPTAKVTATPKPTAKVTATPKPTAKPTATPKPTAKATATPEPTATPTSEPTTEQEPVLVTAKAGETSEANSPSSSGIIIGSAPATAETSDNAAADKEEPKTTPEPEVKVTTAPTATPAVTPERVPTFSVSGDYDWYDLELAARVAYFEAGSSDGRAAVLNVIYNRCRSKSFGGKVTSVETEAYRKSQFSVVRKEKFELTTAPDSLIHMADEIFNQGKTVLDDDVVFFHAVKSGLEWDGKEYVTTIGGNAFFRKAS